MATADSSAQPPPRGLDAHGMDQLAELASEEPDKRIDHAIEIARTILGMDLAYVTQYVDGEQVYRTISGDGTTFGIGEDDGYPWEGTICHRMLGGRIPRVVKDLNANDELRDLAVTKLASIGAYVGVPIILSDNTMFGTLCTISHAERPELDERDQRLMEVLANIVATGIEQQRLEDENRKLRAQIEQLGGKLEEAGDDSRLSDAQGDRMRSRFQRDADAPAEAAEERPLTNEQKNERMRDRLERMGDQLEEAEQDIRLTMILDSGEFTKVDQAPSDQ